MKILICSTCYDLGDLRASLKDQLNKMGFDAYLSNKNDVPYNSKDHTHSSCLKFVSTCDVVVFVLGHRYGGELVPQAFDMISHVKKSKNTDFWNNVEKGHLSISQAEVMVAIQNNIPVYPFINNSVIHKHEQYEFNKKNNVADYRTMEYPQIKKNTAGYIFEFFNYIRLSEFGNAYYPFEDCVDLFEKLKKQLLSEFQRLLTKDRGEKHGMNDSRLISKQQKNTAKKLKNKNEYFNTNNRPIIPLGFLKHRNGFDAMSVVETQIIEVFSIGLVRKSWVIDIEFDLIDVDKGILNEQIIWQYELINVTNKAIVKDISLSYLADDEMNTLIKYTIHDVSGNGVSLMDDCILSEDGLFLDLKKEFCFKAGQTYFIYMHFLNVYNVNSETHKMQNCLGPREPTLTTTMKFKVPVGYVVDVLRANRIPSENFVNRYDFIIRKPLLPGQMIEYFFEKQIKRITS